MVQNGHVAVIHFTGRTVDGGTEGEVFDTTDVDVALETGVYHDNRDYKPLEFRVGEGNVIPGIEDAVREMDVGEERTVQVSPEEAFGERAESKVVEVPREDLEARSDTDAAEGELVTSEAGQTGWITDVDERTVTVDFNHELAGETLAFEIRVLDAYEGPGGE